MPVKSYTVNRDHPKMQHGGESPGADDAYLKIERLRPTTKTRKLRLCSITENGSMLISTRDDHAADFLYRAAAMFIEVANELKKEYDSN